MLNPESRWEGQAKNSAIDPAEIESRIGSIQEPVSLLSGGLANTNIKIGKNRVLRIYRRDPAVMPKERALLLRPWQFLTVPKVLASGHDYILMSYVEHHALKGSQQEGEALGCALSEIHASGYPSAGFLGQDLQLSDSWKDGVDALVSYMDDCFRKMDSKALGGLGAGARRAFERHAKELRQAWGSSVLLHADFKLSNLHATASGLPLVLDWEFAYAGSRYSDIGQLMRWSPPGDFVDGFEAAYQAADLGPRKEWQRLARLMDLPNLAGLLLGTPPGSIRGRDLSVLIKEIIQ